MSIDWDVSEIRRLTSAIHAEVQAARVAGAELDHVRRLQATSDALRHLVAALEDLERRVHAIERERPSWMS